LFVDTVACSSSTSDDPTIWVDDSWLERTDGETSTERIQCRGFGRVHERQQYAKWTKTVNQNVMVPFSAVTPIFSIYSDPQTSNPVFLLED